MAASLLPARAPVRPRVVRADPSLPRLLEDEVADLLRAGVGSTLFLIGPPGAGKTTALAHLAAAFAHEPRLALIDDAVADVAPAHGVAAGAVAATHVVVIRAQVDRSRDAAACCELAPWSDDEVLEYLLARHPHDVARAFAAWRRRDVPAHDLRQWPRACSAVLDALAAGKADDIVRALRLVVWEGTSAAEREAALQRRREVRAAVAAHPLLCSATARVVVAADDLLRRAGEANEVVALPRAALRAVAAWLLATEPARGQKLVARAAQPAAPGLAAVLTLLCAAEPGFRPPCAPQGNLRHAVLRRIDLREMHVEAWLLNADLTGADLRQARLRAENASGLVLCGARLDGATCDGLYANGLRAADMSAPGASFANALLRDADLRRACLDAANLRGAKLMRARLDGASLRGADLRLALLHRARLRGADLHGANLEGAALAHVDLRQTVLAQAQCAQVGFERADLSGTRFPGFAAERAHFCGADLTAAQWPGARLCGADFADAYLADVQLEDADLRDCKFDRATFHLGSSRSGLVDSTIACEGSRTGFYTDESLESAFRAPEDVRKANLRGCDLRGANVVGADFYLVDLRGARLDPEQREWLLRCRAILDPEA